MMTQRSFTTFIIVVAGLVLLGGIERADAQQTESPVLEFPEPGMDDTVPAPLRWNTSPLHPSMTVHRDDTMSTIASRRRIVRVKTERAL